MIWRRESVFGRNEKGGKTMFALRTLVCGLLLLLPIPLPFSNGLPALTVVLLAAAMLERDGYFVLAGLLLFALTAAYFGSLFFGGATAVEAVYQWGSSLRLGAIDDAR